MSSGNTTRGPAPARSTAPTLVVPEPSRCPHERRSGAPASDLNSGRAAGRIVTIPLPDETRIATEGCGVSARAGPATARQSAAPAGAQRDQVWPGAAMSRPRTGRHLDTLGLLELDGLWSDPYALEDGEAEDARVRGHDRRPLTE